MAAFQTMRVREVSLAYLRKLGEPYGWSAPEVLSRLVRLHNALVQKVSNVRSGLDVHIHEPVVGFASINEKTGEEEFDVADEDELIKLVYELTALINKGLVSIDLEEESK